VRQAAGEALADTDAKEALELLAQDPARDTQNTLQQLAERFSQIDREKSLLFAEEAAVQARALEQPDRARAMAQAGTVLTKLGRGAAGRKLIDEATETARRLGTEGMQGYARAAVAQAVASFDVKLALELIEPLKEPNDKDRYSGFVATGIAAADPARAVALADAMVGNSSAPEDVKTEVAYRIGGDRPEEAIKIIEGMKGFSADKARAEALGWLAVAVAQHDPPRAFALIDRALSYPLDHPEAFQSWVYFGGGTASAGLIAANARRIGYPDMESVVMRVLASRPTGRGAFDDPAMQTQSATIAASILALTDPAAARELLRQIELQSGFSPADLSKAAGRHWLQAWALADLKHAEALFQTELAALAGQNDQKLDLQMTGLFKMVEVLAVPLHRRETYLLDEIGAHWHPGRRN
jgi:hypothetical protein